MKKSYSKERKNPVLTLYWKPTERCGIGAIQEISIFTEVTCILKQTQSLEWMVRYLRTCLYTCIMPVLSQYIAMKNMTTEMYCKVYI